MVRYLDAKLDAGFDDPAQIFRAGAMTCQARQAARQRPTPIAIHNDRDMGGDYFR